MPSISRMVVGDEHVQTMTPASLKTKRHVVTPRYGQPPASQRKTPAPLTHQARRKQRGYRLQSLYGITLREYDALFKRQKGVCAICHQAETRIHPKTKQPRALSVDHDHDTGAVRGLLCHNCNIALGMVDDDIPRLRSMIGYLRNARVRLVAEGM